MRLKPTQHTDSLKKTVRVDYHGDYRQALLGLSLQDRRKALADLATLGSSFIHYEGGEPVYADPTTVAFDAPIPNKIHVRRRQE